MSFFTEVVFFYLTLALSSFVICSNNHFLWRFIKDALTVVFILNKTWYAPAPILSNIPLIFAMIWRLQDVSFFFVVDIIIQSKIFGFPSVIISWPSLLLHKSQQRSGITRHILGDVLWFCPLSFMPFTDSDDFFLSFCRSSVGGGIGKNPFGAEQRAGGDSKRSTSRDWRPIARNWGKMNDLQRYTKDWSMNHFSDEKFHQPPKNFLDHAAIKIGLQTIDFIT